MDIYSKIDAIFSGEAEDKPKWAEEILSELKEIRILLKEHNQQETKEKPVQKVEKDYYDFVKQFRLLMKPNLVENIYPSYFYKDRVLGIDARGLLYDKETTQILPRHEAFEIYRYAYEMQDKIKISA